MKIIMNEIKIKYIYLALVIGLFWLESCQDDITDRTDFDPSIVVDGRIESNNYPRVFLTRNIPYFVNIDSADIINLVLREAKVTVSDGVDSEILTLMYDKNLFPPYYYQGTDMIGKAGNTYQLTINYGNITLTSSTTIPSIVIADSVWFQPKSDDPNLGEILVGFHDNPLQKNYYKTFTKIVGQETDFYPTLLSNFDDQLFNGQYFIFHLDRGPESYLNLNQKDFSFSRNDTVFVKICNIDENSYAFWNSYQNEISNGANPFASSFHEISSNIEGGLGIWCGYGTMIYKIIAK